MNETLSGAFRGELSVGAVDAFAFGSATVRDFEVRDLDGEVVLHVDRGELELDPLPLLFGGPVIFRNVLAEGGRLVLRPGRESSVSIAEAFDGAGPDDGGPSRALDFGWMVAHDVELRVAVIDRPLVFGVHEASVRVARDEGEPIEVDLASVAALMREPTPLGASVGIVDGSGEVRPDTRELLAVDAGACLGDSPMRVRVRYGGGPASHARLTLDYSDAAGLMTTFVMRFAGVFSSTLEVGEAELPGVMPDCP